MKTIIYYAFDFLSVLFAARTVTTSSQVVAASLGVSASSSTSPCGPSVKVSQHLLRSPGRESSFLMPAIVRRFAATPMITFGGRGNRVGS